MANLMAARTRFAPSPTGRTHLGSGRTALYSYLLARQTGGQFILRIEDTDQKRFVPGAEEELIAGLRWLGLNWDEGPDIGGPYGPYRQSERKQIYQQYAQQLLDTDRAFYCFCTSEHLEKVRQEQKLRKESTRYDGACRHLSKAEAAARVASGEPHVIRFKMPKDGSITTHEHMRGDITVDNSALDDSIIVKSDGLPVYHLAAMVDDHLMKITHVIRGSEWLSTFPLHVHIIRALGWQEPVWMHLSVFLKPSGKGKMSKRESADLMQDGYSIFIKDLQSLGYIPEAVVNWTTLMGWSYDGHTEFFTLNDLVEKFSIDRLNPSPAAINFSKLDYFDGLHMRSLAPQDLAVRVKPFFEKAGYSAPETKLLEVARLIQERIITLNDAPEMAGFFFQEQVHPRPEDLVGKKMTPAQAAAVARRAYEILKDVAEFNHETAEQPLRLAAEQLELSAGQFFGVLRAAITGQIVSPPLIESMDVIGKEAVLQRLLNAIAVLEAMPPVQ